MDIQRVNCELTRCSNFSDFSEEVQINVLRFLSPNELSATSLVSRTWYQLSNDNILWKQLVLKIFPSISVFPESYKQEFKNFKKLDEILKTDPIFIGEHCSISTEGFYTIDQVIQPCSINICYSNITPHKIFLDEKLNIIGATEVIHFKANIYLNYVKKILFSRQEVELFFSIEGECEERISKKLQIYQDYLNQQLENKIDRIVQKNLKKLSDEDLKLIRQNKKIEIILSIPEEGKNSAEVTLVYDYNEQNNCFIWQSPALNFHPTNNMQEALTTAILCRTIQELEDKKHGVNSCRLMAFWSLPKRKSDGVLTDIPGSSYVRLNK